MLDAVLARPGGEHLPQPTGELVNRFRDDAGEIVGYIWWPAIFVGQASFAIAAVAIMLRIDVLMTVVVLLPLLVVVVVAQLATARLQHYRRLSRTATGGVTGFLGEVFGAVQAVQVGGCRTARRRALRRAQRAAPPRHGA